MDNDTRVKKLERIAKASARRLAGAHCPHLSNDDQMVACTLEELGFLQKDPDDEVHFVGEVSPSAKPTYEEST